MISRPKLDAENDADCTLGLDLERFHVLKHQAVTLVFATWKRMQRWWREPFWRAINECNGCPAVAIHAIGELAMVMVAHAREHKNLNAATLFTVPGLGRAWLVTRHDDVSGGSVAQKVRSG